MDGLVGMVRKGRVGQVGEDVLLVDQRTLHLVGRAGLPLVSGPSAIHRTADAISLKSDGIVVERNKTQPNYIAIIPRRRQAGQGIPGGRTSCTNHDRVAINAASQAWPHFGRKSRRSFSSITRAFFCASVAEV